MYDVSLAGVRASNHVEFFFLYFYFTPNMQKFVCMQTISSAVA